MELSLILLISTPLVAAAIESASTLFYKRLTGFVSIFFTTLVLIFSVFLANRCYYNTNGIQFLFNQVWIAEWGINFKLGLNGLSSIFIVLVSSIFFVTAIISKKSEKDNSYYIFLMILETVLLGFIVSYDLILKMLFWEISWIPLFLMLVTTTKKNLAISLSKYWFVSEVLIITALVLLFNHVTMTYDLEKIALIQIGKETVFSVIFFMFILGILIRIGLFPFDGLINKSIETCNYSVSILTTVLTTIIPFVFMISVVYPIFYSQFSVYTNVLAIISIISLIVCTVRLFTSKKITTIVTAQLIMYNALIFIWLTRPSSSLLNATIEILVIKVAINILIIYFGQKLVSNYRQKTVVDLWMFIIPLILSFGIPGILITKPLFVLASSWYKIEPYVSITTLAALMISLVLIAINVSPLFKITKENEFNIKKFIFSVNFIVMLIVLLATITVSAAPFYLHDLSANYYKTSLNRGN